MQAQNIPRSSFNWGFLILWTFATAVGWLIGMLLSGFSPLVESGIGVLIGVMQWLVLRSRLPNSYWWILATAAGWFCGRLIALGFFSPEFGILAGSAIGAVVGSCQWLILRKIVRRAYWWVVISILGWTWAMTGVLGMYLIGAVVGAITGIALDFLYRQPISD